MNKAIIYLVIATIPTLSSCTKLNEDQYDEHIERPQVDIEVPPPTWESTPEIDNELNFEITPH